MEIEPNTKKIKKNMGLQVTNETKHEYFIVIIREHTRTFVVNRRKS